MKRIHWWTLLGISGAGLLAALLGPAVWGQPEGGLPVPLPPALFPQPKGVPDMAPMLPASIPDMPAPVIEPLQPLPLPHVNGTDGTTQAVPTAGIKRAPGPVVELPAYENDVGRHLVSSGGNGNQLAPLLFNVPPGKQQPAVSIEWVGPAATRIHQPMPCQIVVRNASNAPAQNVIVRHRLGQGVAVKSCEPKAVNENGELIWDLGTLAPEQTRRIKVTLVSHSRGAMNCHASVTFTAVAGHQVQVREPMLAAKIGVPPRAIAGELVTIQVGVSNPGDGPAELVKLKVMLPEGLEHPRGKVVEFDVGSVAPGELRTTQFTCVAKGTGAQNCAIVASADGNLTCNDAASLEILIPKLNIALSGPKLRYLYRHAVYTLKVTNPGSAPASNIEISEVIPAGFRVHQAHGGQYYDATRQVSWMVGELQPGQSKEFALDLIPIKTGDHQLTAHAKTARGLKSDAEISTLVEGLPSLEIEVTHMDDPIEVGAETSFEIRVANKGTEAETNVEVACTLPEQLEFIGAKCTTTLRFRQEGRELIFEKMPRLAPRGEEIFRVQVKGLAPGDIRFKTRIRADGLKDPVRREESMRVYSDEAPQRPAVVHPTPLPLPSMDPSPSPPRRSMPGPLPLPTPVMPTIPPPTSTGPGSPPPTPSTPSPFDIPGPVALPIPPPGV